MRPSEPSSPSTSTAPDNVKIVTAGYEGHDRPESVSAGGSDDSAPNGECTTPKLSGTLWNDGSSFIFADLIVRQILNTIFLTLTAALAALAARFLRTGGPAMLRMMKEPATANTHDPDGHQHD